MMKINFFIFIAIDDTGQPRPQVLKRKENETLLRFSDTTLTIYRICEDCKSIGVHFFFIVAIVKTLVFFLFKTVMGILNTNF